LSLSHWCLRRVIRNSSSSGFIAWLGSGRAVAVASSLAYVCGIRI
jgi:hypothetical protein